MNTIRCSIVEDLLPLYIDGALRINHTHQK